MRRLLFTAGIALSVLAAVPVRAEQSVLESLSRETEQLYAGVRNNVVRVYLPPPRWALNLMGQDFTVKRWDSQLDPTVREKLREDTVNKPGQRFFEATVQPATQPSTQPAEPRSYRLVPRGDGSFDLVSDAGDDKAVIDVSPRSVGIAIDTQGHILLPYYIEKEAIGDQPLAVATGDGAVTSAKFIGSDRQTGLTVLRVDRPFSSARLLEGRRPADGALVMFLNLAGESGRLQVWTGGQQETGVVFSVKGEVSGFLRQGQFLEAAKCRPVAEQLIEQGKIKRPVLGVFLREVLPADPTRRDTPALGTRPAVVVMKVIPESAADKAGVLDGDIILSLGNEIVGDPPSFAAAMTGLRGPTPVTILRGTQVTTLTVDLQPR